MKTWRFFVSMICVSICSFAGGDEALAASGRDYPGYYEVVGAADHGETIQVTLSIRILNYGDAPLFGATVWLLDLFELRRTELFLGTLDISLRGSARASATVEVRREEYARWEEGGMPALFLSVRDERGQLVNRAVEVIPGSTGAREIAFRSPVIAGGEPQPADLSAA